jgi:hypothetical protein
LLLAGYSIQRALDRVDDVLLEYNRNSFKSTKKSFSPKTINMDLVLKILKREYQSENGS